ncbi:hypothetical protein Anas_08326, partial [Armadillidium nasatum]
IRIGEVQLRTQRSVLPLKVESIDGQMGSCTCTLRNKSLFPLDLSVKLSDHEQFLSIYPERLSIPSQGDSTIEIQLEDGSRILSKEVKLEPKEKLNLMINFTPSKRELYLGSLMCIYKNAHGKTTRIALSKDEENDEKCPSLSDDPIVFYNSCKILNIPLCRDIPENDISTTMINAGVDMTTMKSFMIKNME